MAKRVITKATAQQSLNDALWDLLILEERESWPAGVSGGSICGTAAANLRCVANYLEQCRGCTFDPMKMLQVHPYKGDLE